MKRFSRKGRGARARGETYRNGAVIERLEREEGVDAATAEKLMKIVEALEDSDDVQNVYTNFDASEEVLASIG